MSLAFLGYRSTPTRHVSEHGKAIFLGRSGPIARDATNCWLIEAGEGFMRRREKSIDE